MEFKYFDEKDNERYREHYLKCLQMTADMTPFNLLSLRGEPAYIKRAYKYDMCFHQGDYEERKINFCPVGEWDTADWKKIFAEEFPTGTYFWGIPELLMKQWVSIFGDAIEVEESRDDWDYVWYTKRMSEAEGSLLKSYRKNRNKFQNHYQCVEEPMTPDNFDEVREFHKQQIELLRERTSSANMVDFDDGTFETVLSCWDDRYLYGTVYRIDGEIAGVLINEIIDENNVVGLYQKQDRKFTGITEYIYISDCKHLIDNGFMVFNVMSDAGSEGLREAKLRSNPLVLLKKYNITVK